MEHDRQDPLHRLRPRYYGVRGDLRMNRASGGEYRLSLLGIEVSFVLKWTVSDGSRGKRERRNNK